MRNSALWVSLIVWGVCRVYLGLRELRNLVICALTFLPYQWAGTPVTVGVTMLELIVKDCHLTEKPYQEI